MLGEGIGREDIIALIDEVGRAGGAELVGGGTTALGALKLLAAVVVPIMDSIDVLTIANPLALGLLELNEVATGLALEVPAFDAEGTLEAMVLVSLGAGVAAEFELTGAIHCVHIVEVSVLVIVDTVLNTCRDAFPPVMVMVLVIGQEVTVV